MATRSAPITPEFFANRTFAAFKKMIPSLKKNKVGDEWQIVDTDSVPVVTFTSPTTAWFVDPALTATAFGIAKELTDAACLTEIKIYDLADFK